MTCSRQLALQSKRVPMCRSKFCFSIALSLEVFISLCFRLFSSTTVSYYFSFYYLPFSFPSSVISSHFSLSMFLSPFSFFLYPHPSLLFVIYVLSLISAHSLSPFLVFLSLRFTIPLSFIFISKI
jgi:hypothetical protein